MGNDGNTSQKPYKISNAFSNKKLYTYWFFDSSYAWYLPGSDSSLREH